MSSHNILTFYRFININLVYRYIVCLIPIALVTGPFLSDLLSVISSLIFLYLSFIHRDWKYFKPLFVKIFFAWCLFIIFSSLMSINPIHSLESSLFYWRFGLFSLSIWYIFDKDNEIKKYFTLSLATIFIILILDGYLQFITGFNIIGYEYNIVHARITSFFGEEQILGNYLSRLLPILFASIILFNYNSKFSVFFMMLILFSTDILIFLSGERSAFIYLLIGTMMIIILTTKWQKIRIITFASSLILIVFLSLNNNYLKNRMIDQTINQANIFSENYVADHELFFVSAYKMFLDKPFIGHGTKMYREICHESSYFLQSELWNSCSTHPHNSYFQLLAETGLIGTIPVIFLFFYVSYKLIMHFFSRFNFSVSMLRDHEVCLYIAIFITLWPLNTNLNFFGNWINVIYFLPIGMLLSSIYNDDDQIRKI